MVFHKFNCQSDVFKILPRLICNTSRFDHISPVLFQLHWLPVHFRITFQVLVITYKAVYGMAPTSINISILINIKSKSNCSLISNNELLLEHPRVRTKKTLGYRTFCATVPKFWNVLPDTLREITSVD